VQPNGGDRASLFNDAYTHYSPAITGYLETKGVQDPEAAAQDIFLDLYEQMADYRGTLEGVRPLVFGIAYARVAAQHRHLQGIPVALEYRPDTDERLSAAAEDAVVGQDSATRLLDGLAAEQREVMTLRVVGDLSIEQTALIMKKSPGAVKQLQRRALAALRATASKDVQCA
jgi:RNA polymerase sigma-70 factor (ECF subfamily)